jgi:hypothetical protein
LKIFPERADAFLELHRLAILAVRESLQKLERLMAERLMAERAAWRLIRGLRLRRLWLRGARRVLGE